MQPTTLTISSKNYSSWSLRGWLMAKLSGIEFEEIAVDPDDAAARAEILLLSPSILVPCLTYEGTKIWDTLAIGEFLNEIAPKAGLLPPTGCAAPAAARFAARFIRGFTSLRSALPMNLKATFPQLQGLVEGSRRHRPRHADLARMSRRVRRSLSVWRDIHGRCDVCARRDALSHL